MMIVELRSLCGTIPRSWVITTLLVVEGPLADKPPNNQTVFDTQNLYFCYYNKRDMLVQLFD